MEGINLELSDEEICTLGVRRDWEDGRFLGLVSRQMYIVHIFVPWAKGFKLKMT